MERHAHHRRNTGAHPIRFQSDPNPIRSQRSGAEQSGRVVERMIESIVVVVNPEPLAAVGGYVTREETD